MASHTDQTCSLEYGDHHHISLVFFLTRLIFKTHICTWIFPLTVLLILSSIMSPPHRFRLIKNVNVLNPVCGWQTVTECDVSSTLQCCMLQQVCKVSAASQTQTSLLQTPAQRLQNISALPFISFRVWDIKFSLLQKVCHVFLHQVFSEGRRCWTDVFLLGLLAHGAA